MWGGKVSRAVSRKLYLDEENGGSAARFFYSIPCEKSLIALVLYLTKLVTRDGGNVLTAGVDKETCDLLGENYSIHRIEDEIRQLGVRS